jgi:transposase
MLVQCAGAAKRKKGSSYQAQFFRLRSRRGPQKDICAVAAWLPTAISHMVNYRTRHRDLGAAHFDRRSSEAKARRLLEPLAKLGYQVQLQPAAA